MFHRFPQLSYFSVGIGVCAHKRVVRVLVCESIRFGNSGGNSCQIDSTRLDCQCHTFHLDCVHFTHQLAGTAPVPATLTGITFALLLLPGNFNTQKYDDHQQFTGAPASDVWC